MSELNDLRVRNAEAEYEAYDFGDAIVSEAGPWSYETRGDALEMRCIVYLEQDLDGEGTLSFKVRFSGTSAEPDDVVSMFIGSGAETGCRGNPNTDNFPAL